MRGLGSRADRDLLLAVGPRDGDPPVVLDVLRGKGSWESDARAVFARTVAAYSRLHHPAVLRLYEGFVHGDDLVFVLEYVDGWPLGRLRMALKASPLDDASSLYVAGCVFDALAVAHAATDEMGEPAAILHHHVNPSNVLVARDGRVVLTGFATASGVPKSGAAEGGSSANAYGYLAPEQVRGEIVTPRADVYSGAIVLWELLTRRRAFVRGALPEADAMRALAEPRIVSIDLLRPDVDASLREAIKRALEPRPERRTMTAEEMASVLRSGVSEGEERARLGRIVASLPRQNVAPPPPPELDDEVKTRKMSRSLAPGSLGATRAPTVPRPSPGIPRAAPSAPPVRAPSASAPSVAAPSASPSAARTRTFEKTMPSADLSLEEIASVIEQGASTCGAAPSSRLLDDTRTSVSGLASLLEPSSLEPSSRAADAEVHATTPFAAFTPGVPLRDAIDEIMGDLGSGADLGSRVAASRNADDRMGHLPPAPKTLESSQLGRNATLLMPSSFPQASRTLTMHERVDVSSVPTPRTTKDSDRPTAPLLQLVTAPMAAVPGSFGGTTEPMHAAAPRRGDAVAPTPPPAAAPEPSRPSADQAAIPTAVLPQRRRGARVATTVGVALLLIAGGSVVARYVVQHQARPTDLALRATPRSPDPRDMASAVPMPTAASVALPADDPFASAPSSVAAVGSSSPSAAIATPSSALAPAPPNEPSVPSATASALSTPPPPAEDGVPAGMGRLLTTGTIPGRRIFVDERVVGQTPETAVVKCGPRRIRLGSAGSTQSVDVPCRGQISVGDR